MSTIIKEATFGAGCFWCIEACFKELKGVNDVIAGYSGGAIKNPAYREVCAGTTGHAEVARVIYNENEVSFDELLEVFWFVHDPTTLNRQGNDVGEQYRSVIFFHDQIQQKKAEAYKSKLSDNNVWERPIVTAIEPLKNFYPAEKEHENYYNQNPNQPYCNAIIRPKVEKFKAVFAKKLK